MKQAIYLRIILRSIILFSTACSGATQSPTASPTGVTQLPSEAAPAPTEIPLADTPAPGATSGVSPTSQTQPVTLFTESGGVYNVNHTPADFVETVVNPYFPLAAGAKWEYEIRVGGKLAQTDTLEVLKEKKEINGVHATVVRDTVLNGSKIVEDTFDWFAQDK